MRWRRKLIPYRRDWLHTLHRQRRSHLRTRSVQGACFFRLRSKASLVQAFKRLKRQIQLRVVVYSRSLFSFPESTFASINFRHSKDRGFLKHLSARQLPLFQLDVLARGRFIRTISRYYVSPLSYWLLVITFLDLNQQLDQPTKQDEQRMSMIRRQQH